MVLQITIQEYEMFYKVKAKCGHVGRNNYIEKTFYVTAHSGKEAARKVRYLPRVKHDRKDAILSVEQISRPEFVEGNAANSIDKYFKVTNSSEQRLLKAVDPGEIRPEPHRKKYKKKRDVSYIMKRMKILQKQYDKMMSEVVYG